MAGVDTAVGAAGIVRAAVDTDAASYSAADIFAAAEDVDDLETEVFVVVEGSVHVEISLVDVENAQTGHWDEEKIWGQ